MFSVEKIWLTDATHLLPNKYTYKARFFPQFFTLRGVQKEKYNYTASPVFDLDDAFFVVHLSRGQIRDRQ